MSKGVHWFARQALLVDLQSGPIARAQHLLEAAGVPCLRAAKKTSPVPGTEASYSAARDFKHTGRGHNMALVHFFYVRRRDVERARQVLREADEL